MFIVEANIGAGKTTLLQSIAERLPHITVAFEPLNAWHRQEAGTSLLQKFYEDPKRWAFSIESFAMACRVIEHLQQQQQTNKNPYTISERSIFSGHYCFAQNSYTSGLMSEIEWQLYLKWFNFLIPGKCELPMGFIYLQTSPEVAFERIQKRSRTGEEGITPEYIQQIHQAHENMLIEKKDLLPGLESVPTLILDVNEDFQQNETLLKQHLEKIQEFMDKAIVDAANY